MRMRIEDVNMMGEGQRGRGIGKRRRIAWQWESNDENMVMRGDENAAMEGQQGQQQWDCSDKSMAMRAWQ